MGTASGAHRPESQFPPRGRATRPASRLIGPAIGLAAAAWVFAVPASSGPDTPSAVDRANAIDFSRQIRSILATNCFPCHGPDAAARKAKLRLDSFEGAIAPRRWGQAITPGAPEASLLVERITDPDPEFRMPPPEAKRTLTAEQIELLRTWIEQGAEYEAHLAFSTPQRPAVPAVRDQSWVRNEIDAFILARLEQERLQPTPEATREALIRRLSFDLTGLPPSIDEIDAFLADESPNAYEKVIDRLLASPRFGERMAVDWLDAARYADTHGYHYDNERTMWRWRDWVVEAYNRNLPYDAFTIEQLAGDLLPEPTRDQLIATGFNRNHGISWEGGIIPEEYRVEYVVDRVSTTATVWMGLTMGCARCHDHKFDPVSQREFYAFSGFFNSIDEKGADGQEGNAAPLIATPTTEERQELETLTQRFETLAKEYDAPQPEIDAAQARWEQALAERWNDQWSVIDPVNFTTDGRALLIEQDDHSLFAEGPHPAQDTYEIRAIVEDTGIGAIRFEAMADERLPGGGPGRASHSNFVLSELELEIAPLKSSGPFKPVKLIAAQADFSQRGFFIDRALDGRHETGWAVQGEPYGETRTAIFVAEAPFGFEGGTVLRFRAHHRSGYTQHSIGRVRLAYSNDKHLLDEVRPSVLGLWHVSRPYPAESAELAYGTAFPPEEGVDLDAVDEAGEPVWTLDEAFVDGTLHTLEGEQRSTYLHRVIDSPSERTMRIALGSDDALKVWLNGSEVFASDAPRGAAPDQDFVDLDLRPGANDLLMKVVNYAGEYAFYFDPREDHSLEEPLGIIAKAARPPAERNERQQRLVRDHFRSSRSEAYRAMIAELRDLEKQHRALETSMPSTMVMRDLEEPRETYVLMRGRYDLQGDPVEPGVPAFMPPLPEGAPTTRLGLAQWLVEPSHPLTARVAVNRMWRQLFGEGIVRTVEDFGTQSTPPSHPELLDWLATEFVRRDWNVKAMLKLMAMSATYRQGSACTDELLERDPDNELLGRGPRFRLSAEMLRDASLAASGLLVDKRGGPPVKPYQPAGLWKEVGSDFEAFSANLYRQDEGEDLHRRSLYTFWKRTLPPPAMQTFDAPTREFCVVRRSRTNTPQQALVLMNDPTFVEAARALAQRSMLEQAEPEARIVRAFRLVTARRPAEAELRLLLDLYAAQLDVYRSDPDAALALISVGEAPRDETLDPAELAALTVVTSTILNLDEAVTKG